MPFAFDLEEKKSEGGRTKNKEIQKSKRRTNDIDEGIKKKGEIEALRNEIIQHIQQIINIIFYNSFLNYHT